MGFFVAIRNKARAIAEASEEKQNNPNGYDMSVSAAGDLNIIFFVGKLCGKKIKIVSS